MYPTQHAGQYLVHYLTTTQPLRKQFIKKVIVINSAIRLTHFSQKHY